MPFHAGLGGTWGELNLGLSGQITRNTSLFVNESYEIWFDGDGHAYCGKIGLRFNW